jgi:hypothetical protein
MRGSVVYRGRHVTVSYEPSKTGIAGIAMSRPVANACHDVVANRALPHAVAIAPVHTGDYISSFRIEEGTTVIAAMRRVAVLLLNFSDHAIIVELGSDSYGEGSHVLGKTLDHLNRGPI